VHQKKKIQGFPPVLHLNFFKTALKRDLKQWSIRHRRRRHRYRCRHRRSGSNVERKMNDVHMANVSHGQQEIHRTLRRGSLTVR
jgi:hypothetical protein